MLTCEHCGKPINAGRSVPLELDQRSGTYHDLRDVPPEYSQGWFDFGPDCAKKLRNEEIKRRTEQNKPAWLGLSTAGDIPWGYWENRAKWDSK